MVAFVALARSYPKAVLVFTGGNSEHGAPSEAQLARKFLNAVGLGNRRSVFEGKSRNTYENAVFTFNIVKPKLGERWLLVTSAVDMPRAMGCFRRLKWNVVPVPVDFHARGPWWQVPGLPQGLIELDWAAHEWIGLVYYRLRGWTDALLPSP